MDLIELVRLNNRLAELTVSDIQQDAGNRAESIIHQLDVSTSDIDNGFQQRLIEKNQTLQQAFFSFEQDVARLKNEVQRQIDLLGNEWLQRSYARYEQQLEAKAAQTVEALGYHHNKPVRLNAEVETMFKTRVGAYNDWHYPAMVIHPMLEPFIHEMVASDPLYVVDESHYLIDPTIAQFNQQYQHRLRLYVIEESVDYPILGQLPDEQFGFCLAYNYLNYRPFEIIKKYLSELYQKLRPGGVLAMTFNDCDRYQALQSVEQDITCYTPGSLIRGWAKYVGFEEIFCYQDSGPSVWVEFQRPGESTSLRGGQSLAKILPKPVAKSK